MKELLSILLSVSVPFAQFHDLTYRDSPMMDEGGVVANQGRGPVAEAVKWSWKGQLRRSRMVIEVCGLTEGQNLVCKVVKSKPFNVYLQRPECACRVHVSAGDQAEKAPNGH
jgi:hypothetical protein